MSPGREPSHRSMGTTSTDKELRLEDAVVQFLKSWNREYRCGHYYRDKCYFKKENCYWIHDNTTHATIAKELRLVLRNRGDLKTSSFFRHIVYDVEKRGYKYTETLSLMRQEILTLSRGRELL